MRPFTCCCQTDQQLAESVRLRVAVHSSCNASTGDGENERQESLSVVYLFGDGLGTSSLHNTLITTNRTEEEKGEERRAERGKVIK